MSVNLVLLAFGVACSLCILATAWWALTRSEDRIQLATACLFVSAIGCGAVAASLLSKGGDSAFGVLLGTYALGLYLVMAALAIWFKRWAWQVSIAAFGLQLLVAVLAANRAFAQGATGVVSLALWVAVAALGLWACLHRGSRQLVAAQRRVTQSGSQRLLAPSPHTTHRAGPQWAVQQVGSLDEVLLGFQFV